MADEPKILGPGFFKGVPNALTFMRLFAVPFFLWAVLTERYAEALVLLIFAGLTDVLDGYIARRYHQQTKLGGFIDPMADKILGATCYLSFSLKGLIPPWLGALVFTRDVAISLGALVLVLLDMQVIAKPSILGKRTTLAQVVTISIAILAIFEPVKTYVRDTGLIYFFFILTAALTIASGVHYMALSFKDYNTGALLKPARKGAADGS